MSHLDVDLIEYARRLRERFEKNQEFNVFTALRSKTDEVRLHTRFIAALLDPKQNSYAKEFAGLLLRRFGLDDFVESSFYVRQEFNNIDILITNSSGESVIIENKIGAQDQENQLARYYESRKNESHSKRVHVLYLTLNGSQPSEGSLGDLEPIWPQGGIDSDKFSTVSYAQDIASWLKACARTAFLDPPLRESIVQYHSIIQELTGQDMKDDHLEELAQRLTEGSNLIVGRDLALAYQRALAKRQQAMWVRIREAVEKEYPQMAAQRSISENESENLFEKCLAYVNGSSKQLGLYYSIPGIEQVWVAIETEQGDLYAGIKCSEEESPEQFVMISDLLDSEGQRGKSNHLWPTFSYEDIGGKLRSPGKETLELLSEGERFESFVSKVSEKLFWYWEFVMGNRVVGS